MTAFVGYLHTPGSAPVRQVMHAQPAPSADAVGFLHIGRFRPVRCDFNLDRPEPDEQGGEDHGS